MHDPGNCGNDLSEHNPADKQECQCESARSPASTVHLQARQKVNVQQQGQMSFLCTRTLANALAKHMKKGKRV